MSFEEIIRTCNLSAAEKEELQTYCANKYSAGPTPPSEDRSYLNVWFEMVKGAETQGAAAVINESLCWQIPVEFAEPDHVRVEIYPSFAGDIPIIYVENASDYEQLVTNLVHKGVRPANIEKTGASFISGKTIRFIILSAKPYSNVPASELGTDESEWGQKSMLIRRAHECTHFFTKRYYGMAFNNLHDELMADFIGVYDAFGFYKAEWFLRFIGVIEGSGSRIDAYTEGLSPKAKDALILLAREAAAGLENWSNSSHFKSLGYKEMIEEMCRAGIAGMTDGSLPFV